MCVFSVTMKNFCYGEKEELNVREGATRKGLKVGRRENWPKQTTHTLSDRGIILRKDIASYEFPFPTLRQTLRATRYFYILYPIKPAKSINILTGIFKQHSPSPSPSSFSMHAAYRPFSSISQS